MSMRDRIPEYEGQPDSFDVAPHESLRKAILDDAANAIMGARNEAYGKPENNFAHIAGLLNAMGYVRTGKSDGLDPRDGAEVFEWEDLNATDVAIILACLKLGRIKTNRTHRDSWVDLAGYAACGYEVASEVEGGGQQ